MKKDLAKTNILVRKKFYLVPYGAEPYEIFQYSKLFLDLYLHKGLAIYNIDGLMYTPLNKPYLIKTTPERYDIDEVEYKWKPINHNSIDFYVVFIKDENNEVQIYSDSKKSGLNNYVIATLHVGKYYGNDEVPIPFKIDKVIQQVHMYLDGSYPKDNNGDIIEDETVVEFIYNENGDENHRWVPIRTRYDKTESVVKYKTKYGNNLNIAKRVFQSILNSISEEHLYTLAEPKNFNNEMKRINSILSNKTNIPSPNTGSSNQYYQKITNLAVQMRSFHNWIKTNMLQLYTDKKSVLDIGCGRGGDIHKMIHAGINFYVGIDIDYAGLYQTEDSAFNRYKSLKDKNKNIPDMIFIQADARQKFDLESQNKTITNMTGNNKILIEKYLNPAMKYDVINCQFAIHYFMSDDTIWNNFCENINNHLSDDGYLLITTFDGDIIKNKLTGKKNMTVFYIDETGNSQKFFDIKKIYDDTKTDITLTTGVAIDMYNATINENNVYVREFLVFPDFIIKSFDAYDIEIVETDTFENLYNIHKQYFINAPNNNGENKNFLLKEYNPSMIENIIGYYACLNPNNDNKYSNYDIELAKAGFELTKLNRYYIFHRKNINSSGSKNNKLSKNKTKDAKNKTKDAKNIMEQSYYGEVLPINKEIKLPYFGNNSKKKFYLDTSMSSDNLKSLYKNLKDKYNANSNNAYLITLSNNNVYTKKIKNGKNNEGFLIFKDNNGSYYPIFHHKDGIRITKFNNKIISKIDKFI
jgi:SAM-dependent methyltransferase